MVRDLFSRNDLVEIGSGATRDVYEIRGQSVPDVLVEAGWGASSNVVVKKAQGGNGRQANKQEYRMWKQSGQDFTLFCPVYDVINGGEYLVMERAKTQGMRHQQVLDVKERYSEKYPVDRDTDIQIHNIGMYEGRSVLIDYSFVPL